ncbi:unnamed protein product [Miscanthus lutarioriparius]|uniref:hAT-like transposase RNase-H fold domain-containing protein n=1 Tax=Miscanthus lutarioriparius TaxID=422564 RepID=A0A811RLI6_9POAL|nr:unnamed protein product [Miscanthus lutarioriparius]
MFSFFLSGSTSKRLASQKPSASPSSSRTPAPPSARGSSTPSETSITNVGTDVEICGDDLEEDEEDGEDQEQAQLVARGGRGAHREVWKYFTKKVEVVEPYKYDQEVSLQKLNLAITMHEYPFNIVEHEYLVDFIKSLRPNFPIKSRITVRKEIMDKYLEEKEVLYAYLKTMQCRFSATMDMWTSCQNKGYMCVTIHWVDDEWRMQKRIIGFFNVKGRHTGAKLSETFTEVMVNWYIEKRLFALTLDNASSNEVAVHDIISDLKDNDNGSLVCDGIFFHVRCACHILNLVARDGLKAISATITKIKSLVLVVKGSPLQWEMLLNDDATISAMAIAMNEKFEKYWRNSTLLFFVACFLDPRYKKKLIEYYMRKFYGDEYQVKLDEFVSVIKKLYRFYASSANATSKKKNSKYVGSIVSDLEVEALSLAMANKLKLEEEINEGMKRSEELEDMGSVFEI